MSPLSSSSSRQSTVFLLVLMLGTRLAAAMSTSASSSSKKGALIFLHGLGDSPAGWSHLAQMLPSMKPKLGEITYVFPPAPTVAITINGGMTMPGWYVEVTPNFVPVLKYFFFLQDLGSNTGTFFYI